MAQVTDHTVDGDTHILTLDNGEQVRVPVSDALPATSGWGQVFEASGHSVATGTTAPVLDGFQGSEA